jgi:C1A family cysteine protease
MESAFEYLINAGGIMSQDDYQYTAQDGDCQFDQSKVVATVSSYKKLDTQDEDEIATFLSENGPLSIAINAEPLQSYSGGIIDASADECDPSALDHGVAIVGYGTEGGQDYWVIRNSWGSNWGEEGYFRFLRGTGVCGVNTDVSIAYVN